ncbi:MAG: hypothetical protein U0K86_00915 [Agathobacter sp.]|nr:hypothetical protein [Agathobacter sp.]
MRNENIRETNKIPIYNSMGQKLDEILLKEKIMPIPNKRGGFSNSGNYYKGAGIVYRNHLECDNNVKEAKNDIHKPQIIGTTGIVYENLIACYPEIVGKFGIFTFKHQPVFSDYEGGCGIKEKKLIDNFKEFELNAIEEIIDVIPAGIENHNIYCYRLKNVRGNIMDTANLLKYVLENDWNTAWDKNLWGDVESFGYIRDIGDWFKSGEFKHKLGTVFALLNSLYRVDKTLYARLLFTILGKYEFDKKNILITSFEIVNKYCSQFSNLEFDTLERDSCFEELYKKLVTGKACCHLEDDSRWDWVRNYYLMQVRKEK